MTGNLIEHVFEKRQTGFRLETAAAVEVERNGNTGFLRIALNAGAARLLVHDCVTGSAGAVTVAAAHYNSPAG